MEIGVVGVGSMGKNHLRVLSELNAASGFVDADNELRKKMSEKFSIPSFSDIKELIKISDGLIIATPTEYHYKLAKEALESGLHVLLEKPMCSTYEQALDLVDIAKDQDLILEIGHIERYNPIIEYVKNFLENSNNLISLSSKRVSSFPTRIRDVGVIFDLGVHEMDIMRSLNGEIDGVYAQGGNILHEKYEDHASIILHFKNGKSGLIETNWLTPVKIRELRLTFTDKYIKGDYAEQWIEVSSSKLKEYDELNLYNLSFENDIRRINLK